MNDNILDLSIKQAGGVGKLAQSLGVRQNVVSNWKTRNKLPLPWKLVLEHRYGERKQPQAA